MDVEENDVEDAMWEANLKLSDLNILMEYFTIKDVLGKVHLCHVTDIDMEWEEISEG